MMRRTRLSFVVLAVAALVACGSSSEPDPTKDVSPTTGSGSSGTAGSTDRPESSNASSSTSSSSNDGGSNTPDAGGGATGENCVPKGHPGNEKKIGMYCDEDTPCPFQVDPFLVCTAGHDPSGTHKFCTAPCSKDSECGSGAYCVKDPAGSGCVPTECGGTPGS